MSDELRDMKTDNARQVFNNIVNGQHIHIPIAGGWFTKRWDSQGNKLVSFATKVALKKGDPNDKSDPYFKNLTLLMGKAKKRSDATACTRERGGYCITHITAKHSPSEDHAARVKKIFKQHHPDISWDKLAGRLNFRKMTAANYARNKNEGTRKHYASQIIPKSRVQKMSREHGLTQGNVNRLVRNYRQKIAIHGHPNTWNNSVRQVQRPPVNSSRGPTSSTGRNAQDSKMIARFQAFDALNRNKRRAILEKLGPQDLKEFSNGYKAYMQSRRR
jgi:hypothetical protein